MNEDEEVYRNKGYKNRVDYLMILSVEYGVPYDTVVEAAERLGHEEDFEGLPALLERWED